LATKRSSYLAEFFHSATLITTQIAHLLVASPTPINPGPSVPQTRECVSSRSDVFGEDPDPVLAGAEIA
jgi:hypothetical protein